jgi:hypothetical protein
LFHEFLHNRGLALYLERRVLKLQKFDRLELVTSASILPRLKRLYQYRLHRGDYHINGKLKVRITLQ